MARPRLVIQLHTSEALSAEPASNYHGRPTGAVRLVPHAQGRAATAAAEYDANPGPSMSSHQTGRLVHDGHKYHRSDDYPQ
jgi:hypothetical protein